MHTLTIDDVLLKGKKVLLRVDFNVPMTPDMHVADDKRIIESLPTIRKILSQGASVILMSHLGRPKGHPNPEFTLKPVADYLATLLNRPVKFAKDCIGRGSARDGDRAEAGGDPHARKPPLPPRGGGERARLLQGARGPRRRVRERRVRHGAPRARVDGGDHPFPAARCRGIPHEEGDRLSDERGVQPRAPVPGDTRRGEDLREDRRHPEPAAEDRCARDRRGDGLHVPPGAGAGDRRLDGGGGKARSRKESPGADAGAPQAVHPSGRLRDRRQDGKQRPAESRPGVEDPRRAGEGSISVPRPSR